MSRHSYLAFDLGASSGRGVLGILEKEKISLKEVNRFYNGMTTIHGEYHWDFLRLFDEIKRGITECAGLQQKPESIGLDTWGVDYALFDSQGSMLGIPYAYREVCWGFRMLTGIIVQILPWKSCSELFRKKGYMN